MAVGIPLVLGGNGQNFTKASSRFINLSLDSDRIRKNLEPIIELICRNVEFAYKSPSKLEFISATSAKTAMLAGSMQFDEVSVKLLHTESGNIFYINLGTNLVRTLIVRMLRTSLVDEDPGVLLSSTEKGIFAFMIARLLSEMTKSLGDHMPKLKILSIFHAEDEALKNVDLNNYYSYYFMFDFSAERYPAVLYAQLDAFELEPEIHIDPLKLLARVGHVKRDFSIVIYRLKLKPALLERMTFGDIILFDRCSLSFKNNILLGQVDSNWSDWSWRGELSSLEERYRFKLLSGIKNHNEDRFMEELHLVDNNNDDNNLLKSPEKLAHLAKHIRVNMSIELSRMPMSLQDICYLKGGEIIDLQRKIDEPLDMVVDGVTIGQCMPVQIDGHLGIRVLNITSGEDKVDS